MSIPANLKYAEDHEWVRVEGDNAVIGITDFAQNQLGDIVFVELPEPGTEVAPGKAVGSIESVKAVNELFCPLSGTVTEVNTELENSPQSLNSDPYEAGWIFKIRLGKPAELDGLMDADAYGDFTANG